MNEGQSVENLIAALADRNNFAAQRTLCELGEQVVDPLIDALQHNPDPQIRSEAAIILGIIGDSKAVEPLVQALNEKDYFVWNSAALALGYIGDERAIEPLLTALYSGKGYFVATALGEFKDTRAVAPIIAALEKDDAPRQYVLALAKFIGLDSRIIPAVITVLGKWDDKSFGYAFDILVDLGAEAVELLIEALNDEKRDYRDCIAWVLGEIGDERAIEPLLGLVNHQDEVVRGGVVRALGYFADERVINTLIRLLSDADSGIRRDAASGLCEISDVRAVQPLRKLLETLDENDTWLRQKIETYLRKLGHDPDAQQ